MRIATFNVNDVNKRLPNLLAWLRKRKPDVVCLQELKTADAGFPQRALEKAGYSAVWKGERTWNGVAILARGMQPIVTRTELPGDPQDTQSRYIEAAVHGILVGCIYLPNGNPQPGPKFDYKLKWFKRLTEHGKALLENACRLSLPEISTSRRRNETSTPQNPGTRTPSCQPESRAAYKKLIGQGWTDALRHLHPDETVYTFWHYMRQRWKRDAGLRLDHLLLSPSLTPQLLSATVDKAVRGEPNASDHAPVWIELRKR